MLALEKEHSSVSDGLRFEFSCSDTDSRVLGPRTSEAKYIVFRLLTYGMINSFEIVIRRDLSVVELWPLV